MILHTALLLSLALIAALPAHAQQTWKCIDATGKVSYRALPDANLECEALSLRTLSPATDEADEPIETPAEPSSALDAETQVKYAAACQQAQRNLRALNSGLPLTRPNAEGIEARVPDSELPVLRERAEREVDFFCNP